MIVELLAEHHLEFLRLKGGCRGSSESTHVKIQVPRCCKSSYELQMLRYYKQQFCKSRRFIRVSVNTALYKMNITLHHFFAAVELPLIML